MRLRGGGIGEGGGGESQGKEGGKEEERKRGGGVKRWREREGGGVWSEGGLLKQCDVINCHWTHATSDDQLHYCCMVHVHAGVDLDKLSRGGKSAMLLTLGGGGRCTRRVLCTLHARRVWGHAPPEKIDPLKSLLVHFQVNIYYTLLTMQPCIGIANQV